MSSTNENNDGINSPMHMGLPGQNWAPEDIQELLGVMGNHPHHEDEGGDLSSHDNLFSQTFPHDADDNLHQETNAETTVSSTVSSGQPTTAAASLPGEDAKAQARSERKRSREKQRRSDVNKQFGDLIDVVQKIDAEDEEDGKPSVFGSSRVKFNPSNRVDLIARTIILLERLHDANKRRKTELETMKKDLEDAKKAGEDTAAKLKEALLAPPGQPANKQFMMMVPMMMSSDGSGATSAVPMMNPYMPHTGMGAMPQPYCPMPAHAMAPQMQQAPVQPTTGPAPAPTAPSQAPIAPAPAAPSTAAPQVAPNNAGTPQPGAAHNPQPSQAQPTHQQQPHHHQPHHYQPQVPAGHQAQYSYMMPAPMAGGGYMMPFPTASHPMAAAAPGQPMQMQMMAHHPQAMHTLQQPSQESQSRQEQKDASSEAMNGGSGNLAHCA